MKRDLEIPKTAENSLFEFRAPNTKSLNGILTVAEACGMKVLSVDMLQGSEHCDILLKVNDGGICGFLSYLSLEYPDYIPLGIYEEIKA